MGRAGRSVDRAPSEPATGYKTVSYPKYEYHYLVTVSIQMRPLLIRIEPLAQLSRWPTAPTGSSPLWRGGWSAGIGSEVVACRPRCLSVSLENACLPLALRASARLHRNA